MAGGQLCGNDAMMLRAKAGLNYEDPLSDLPPKPVCEIAKGRVIYDAENPVAKLYVVSLGRVKSAG
jgi:hypothetical protein